MATFQTIISSKPRRPLVTLKEISEKLGVPTMQLRMSIALAASLKLETPAAFTPRQGRVRYYDHMQFLRWWHAFVNRNSLNTRKENV